MLGVGGVPLKNVVIQERKSVFISENSFPFSHCFSVYTKYFLQMAFGDLFSHYLASETKCLLCFEDCCGKSNLELFFCAGSFLQYRLMSSPRGNFNQSLTNISRSECLPFLFNKEVQLYFAFCVGFIFFVFCPFFDFSIMFP